MMRFDFFIRNKYTFLYGVCLAALLLLLNWLKLRLLVLDHAFEVYIGSIAVLFTALGIWLALKLTRPGVQTAVVEKEVSRLHDSAFERNETEARKLNLSKREIEVLALMAQGLSNQEIAGKLFVSLSTVKTHGNNLFEKMGVKRRTQAIERGRKLGLIPS